MDQRHSVFPLNGGSKIIKEASISPIDRIWNVELAKEVYSKTKKYKNADQISEIIKANENNNLFENSFDIPLSQVNCSVSPEIIKSLFGNRLSLTQSRLEKYVMCGFDYYCSYVLGLRENKKAVFQN